MSTWPKDRETIVIKQKDAPDITVELAKYLDILGSPVRLKILKMLERDRMDVETISHLLWKGGKISSRENTKRHVDKLLSIGLVRKEPGMKNDRPVINYVLVPGSIETVIRTINEVMKLDLTFELRSLVAGVQERFSEEFPSFAIIRVLGGKDDGREFPLKRTEVKIGREDPENKEKYDSENDVILSNEYRAVTRVWKPHARLLLENGQWYIEHCEGKSDTYLWNKKLDKYRKEKLKNGDMINLAQGDKGARLVFILPRSED